MVIWCWFSQTFLGSSHLHTVFGGFLERHLQIVMQRLSATFILQKSSKVSLSLYFKLYANINSFKTSQCFSILQQALIECKTLVRINQNTQRIPFLKHSDLEVFKNLSFISLRTLLNLHFYRILVAFIALLFGRTGVTFPGCQAEGLTMKPKRWNTHGRGKIEMRWGKFSECFPPAAPGLKFKIRR